MRDNQKSCLMQDDTQIRTDSNVKEAQRAPPRRIAVPCWLYDHQHAGRFNGEHSRAQGVREALQWAWNSARPNVPLGTGGRQTRLSVDQPQEGGPERVTDPPVLIRLTAGW